MTINETYIFMAGRDISSSFGDSAHNSLISFSEFKAADTEAKRVKSDINTKMNGSFVLEAAVTDEETGEVTTPTVYFEATTKEALVASITSDIDAEGLLDEEMNGATWVNYKNTFSIEE